ncbi:hypothetical protein [Sporosarcina sp. FSL K6-3457]|uniref:hypothetical protein n=1 Tax=Sporosarcina sp. FSL K6-3457 TaxID=2978204 RepID=UPI0030F95683
MLDISKKRIVTTRKEHECFACLGSIGKGDSVISITAKQDEQHASFHLHLECNKLVAKQKIDLQHGCIIEMEIKAQQELETDGWIFRVGDVFSNPYQASHFKITKIELKAGDAPQDALIHGYRVHPKNHDQKVNDPDVFEENEHHRAWHFNDMWSPDSDK